LSEQRDCFLIFLNDIADAPHHRRILDQFFAVATVRFKKHLSGPSDFRYLDALIPINFHDPGLRAHDDAEMDFPSTPEFQRRFSKPGRHFLNLNSHRCSEWNFLVQHFKTFLAKISAQSSRLSRRREHVLS